MDVDTIYAELTAMELGRCENRIVFRQVSSTNQVGRAIASSYLDGRIGVRPTAIAAAEQTRGRGRLGRSWLSPPGGIYMSLVLPWTSEAVLTSLPLTVAVALSRQLELLAGVACQLKWPNDLMIDGQKLGGILLETVVRGDRRAVIAGFGVNYQSAPDGLQSHSTAILRVNSASAPLAVLAGRLALAVQQAVEEEVVEEASIGEYARRSVHRPGDTLVCATPAGTIRGVFLGFDAAGRLQLRTEGAVETIAAGDLIEADAGS